MSRKSRWFRRILRIFHPKRWANRENSLSMPNSKLKSVEFENHEDLKTRKLWNFQWNEEFLPEFSDVQRQRRRIARRTVTQSWRLKIDQINEKFKQISSYDVVIVDTSIQQRILRRITAEKTVENKRRVEKKRSIIVDFKNRDEKRYGSRSIRIIHLFSLKILLKNVNQWKFVVLWRSIRIASSNWKDFERTIDRCSN